MRKALLTNIGKIKMDEEYEDYKKRTTAKRICPSSGLEFTPIDSRQIFYNDKARDKYSNDIKKKERDLMSPTNKVLKLNHQILNKILGDDKEAKCSRDFLLGGGFSFTYLTNLRVVEGTQFIAIYDMAYQKTQDGNYIISRIEE